MVPFRSSVPLPDALPDADGVAWYPNTFRETRLRADRGLYRVALGAGTAAVVGIGLVILSAARSSLPPLYREAGVALVLLSLGALGVAGLSLTPRFELSRSRYAPVRVGFSSRGIHLAFDPPPVDGGGPAGALRTFIPWASIEGVSPPISPYLRNQVDFQSPERPPPRIRSISEDLVARIATEVEGHTNDLGPD